MRPLLPLLAGALLLPATLAAQAGAGAVVSRDDVPSYYNDPANNIGFSVLLDKATVGSNEGLSVGVFLPGSTVAEHVHDGVTELLYIVSGQMEVTIGGVTRTAGAGSAVYIPADVPHSVIVKDPIEPVHVVQVYSPGGPEQRFKQWKQK